MSELREECGIFGVFLPDAENEDVAHIAYYGVYSLQHRGQEAAGMVVNRDGEFTVHKRLGLVAEVFTEEMLAGWTGKAALAHTRYSTRGPNTVANAQTRLGQVAVAHNGNLVNAPVIRELLEDAGVVFHSSSDSEVILNLIARGATHGLERALTDTMRTVQGSYALGILTEDKLVAVRDPNGNRPLLLGALGNGYIIASESCAIQAVGGTVIRDVEPGEILVIDDDGIQSIKKSEKAGLKTCSFEYIYFARPDSTIDEVNVYESRMRTGAALYREAHVEADLVSGVPESGVVAALGYAEASGVPFRMTLIKNKYVGRSFIVPSQELREKAVNVKLNALRQNVEGKRIILVDDSIVRGTTSRRLVTLLREAGAREVHFRVASPPVAFPCYFGIDIPSRDELAASRGLEEIREMLNADSLAYVSVEGLLDALGDRHRFCTGCFTGIYPIAAPVEEEKLVFETK
ncbi:MAG: amidophosphoribosyltransferase [Spirochaetota bacterium]